MLTIHNLTKMAGAEDTTAATEEDAAEATAELEGAKLTEAQTEMVKTLFKVWDFNGDGVISLGAIHTATVEVGGKKAKVFADFEKMDLNGDNVVTLDEMMTFFGLAVKEMGDEAFAFAVGEMTEAASGEQGVTNMLALAAEMEGATLASGDDDGDGDGEAPPLPELSEAQLQRVEALFKTFSDDLAQPIGLDDLASAKIEIGTSKIKVLDGLRAMDANGDGMVEFDEMKSYFMVANTTFVADEFDVTLDGLQEAASLVAMQKIAKGM